MLSATPRSRRPPLSCSFHPAAVALALLKTPLTPPPQMRPLLALAATAAVCALLMAAVSGAAEEEAKKGNKSRQREAGDDIVSYPHLEAITTNTLGLMVCCREIDNVGSNAYSYRPLVEPSDEDSNARMDT